MTLILRPLMPPAALISSAAIMMPLWVDWPKVACPPVIDPYSPTRMSPPAVLVLVLLVPSFGGQPSSPNDNTASEMKMIAFFRIALLFKELRIVQQVAGVSAWVSARQRIRRKRAARRQRVDVIRAQAQMRSP